MPAFIQVSPGCTRAGARILAWVAAATIVAEAVPTAPLVALLSTTVAVIGTAVLEPAVTVMTLVPAPAVMLPLVTVHSYVAPAWVVVLMVMPVLPAVKMELMVT